MARSRHTGTLLAQLLEAALWLALQREGTIRIMFGEWSPSQWALVGRGAVVGTGLHYCYFRLIKLEAILVVVGSIRLDRIFIILELKQESGTHLD